MSLQTNLRGRLRNTSLPKNQLLMPVFEAIINSIHSIEEKGNVEEGIIKLTILRDQQEELSLKESNYKKIIGFRIEDNGCGFNEKTFLLFRLLTQNIKLKRVIVV